MAAAILVSPDQLGVIWLHLFAAANPPGHTAAWSELWPKAQQILAAMGHSAVWAMTTQTWMIDLLCKNGFVEHGRVIAFSRKTSRIDPGSGKAASIACMSEADLPVVEELDHAAFAPPWQIDSEALRSIRDRSEAFFVFRTTDRIRGYLLASASQQGIHISRVAVHPSDQGKGIGRALINHLLEFCFRRGVPRISVNTQIENRRSRELYRSLLFSETGETYPVFLRKFPIEKTASDSFPSTGNECRQTESGRS